MKTTFLILSAMSNLFGGFFFGAISYLCIWVHSYLFSSGISSEIAIIITAIGTSAGIIGKVIVDHKKASNHKEIEDLKDDLEELKDQLNKQKN